MRGVHVPYNKVTSGRGIESLPLPEHVIVPLHQHTGAPAEAVVQKGDEVKAGQLIGQAKSYVSANIHASICGTIKEIKDFYIPTGMKTRCVVIEGNGKEEKAFMDPLPESASKEELLARIKDAGIVGMGGAQFPTHVKLDAKKPIDTLIINGSECEPFVTSDDRLMVEHIDEVIQGTRIAMKILGVKKAIFAIENNKKEAIERVKQACANSEIEVKVLRSLYPQGAEKTLIYNVLKRVVPMGGLPLDVGVVVQNVATLKAIRDACYEGKPLIERIVTVTGSVKEPKNLVVPVGTEFSYLIESCGGASEELAKVINGGPMMGIAQPSLDVPVIKGTNCVLAMGKSMVRKYEEKDCIRCSKCVSVCPQNLLPTTIALYAKNKRYDDCERLSVMNCVECGCCSYVCPARIPIVQYAKLAKAEVIAKRRRS
ncbi:MAG: electron transport complex subunit RsxC [Candidatus Thermoplasmatota archaeon]|nr:electron transport complex subunit RsxC [Candidatus Thermoplasmatota archaeon]